MKIFPCSLLIFGLLGGMLQAEAPKSDVVWSLTDLIDLALAKNPQTRASWAAAREAGARAEMAKADYFPKLELQAAAQVQDEDEQDYPSTTDLREFVGGAGVELTYLLFDFGGRGARLSAAKAGHAAYLRKYDRVLQDAVLEVQTAFYTHAAAVEALNEAEAFADWEKWNNRSTLEASRIGLASENEVLASTEKLRRSEYQLEKARAFLQQSLGRLNVAVGQPAQTALKVQPLARNVPLRPVELRANALIAQALANRPDLAEGVSIWQAKMAEARAARADYWPKINLQALAQQGWSTSRSIDNAYPGASYVNSNDSLHNYGVGVGFSWEFFDGFYKENKARAATEAAGQASALLEAARLDTSRQVWDAYHNTLVEYQNVTFWKAGRTRAELDFSKMELAAKTGLASEIELRQSRAELAAVRASETRATAEWLIAAARLLHATGQNPATAKR